MRSGSRDPSVRPVTPTDVKQYLFCPLISYYRRVLGLKPVMDSQQEASREEHEKMRKKEKRRLRPLKDERLRGFRPVDCPPLYSERLNAGGELDLLLESRDGELVPVDYKFGRSNGGRAWPDHRAQMVLYAILVEDVTGRVVRRGFVYYAPEERAVEVRVTGRARRWVEGIVRRIHEMDESQIPPETWRDPERCSGGCGYGWVCRG
ncbi:MAG: CRISPR-associated protein Cas4 [Candidatus Korarchaeota archaeon]|nr:CRISPR-associated protein Cas4 [Candidatus Korarchaeota archaeon]